MNGDAFVQDLVKSMPTPQAKLLLLSCLAKYSGHVVYLPVESKKQRRERAAENMIRNGMPTPDIAAALVERFGISMRTALRDVAGARKLSLKNDING